MNPCVRVLLIAALWLGIAGAAENEGRFTHALSAPELHESGIGRLNSDQVAVLDALVRRDLAARLNGRSEAAPKTFSDRLTADERRIAGFDALSSAEAARVNAFVERYQSVVVSRALLSPPVYVSRRATVQPRETKAERKIHGTFTMGFGWGSDGYSERTGSMVLHSEVAPGMHVSVGYSETRRKGGEGLYYYRDDPLHYRPPLLEGP